MMQLATARSEAKRLSHAPLPRYARRTTPPRTDSARTAHRASAPRSRRARRSRARSTPHRALVRRFGETQQRAERASRAARSHRGSAARGRACPAPSPGVLPTTTWTSEKMPVMNAASAKFVVGRTQPARGQFHEARARAGQLHQRIGAPRQIAAVRVKQQLRPARDLPRAGGDDRLAQRRDIAPQPERARIDEAQQLHHHARVQLEFRFEFDNAGIARQQRQQAQQTRAATSGCAARPALAAARRSNPGTDRSRDRARARSPRASRPSRRAASCHGCAPSTASFGERVAAGLQKVDLDDVDVRQRARSARPTVR